MGTSSCPWFSRHLQNAQGPRDMTFQDIIKVHPRSSGVDFGARSLTVSSCAALDETPCAESPAAAPLARAELALRVEDLQRFVVRPIGVVRSTLRTPGDALNQVRGRTRCAARDRPYLRRRTAPIGPGDELIVLTWLHLADRDLRQTHPTGNTNIPLTGVFRTRSPDRPNPIGVHRVTVTALESARSLRVDALEAIDGTPQSTSRS
jgi:tRNA (Thr-GGU) A37 N-methylase